MTDLNSSDTPKPIELLSPAKDLETALAAIDHGADAVYIGPSSFGARASASNTIEDIERLVDYAHQFRARVYATVNTILHDHELKEAEKLIKNLYRAGTDAIIVQDMGILRLDIPPIELHASTQCDTRTVEKAKFLEEMGFSQIVLARELSLTEIAEICSAIKIQVETFIHGALCVSYSGRCHAGEVIMGRSANRGCCPQICRLKYDLVDATGKEIVKDRHLLSLKDFNVSNSIEELLQCGVSSFKIEGRLKPISYVKNVTAFYRRQLDKIIADHPNKYCRSSCGQTEISFTPNLYKSFNRSFTSYFLKKRNSAENRASLFTPKSLGEPLKKGELPTNGDGLSFFNPNDNSYQGFRVNKVTNGRIIPARPIRIPNNVTLYRTYDNEWEKLMSRKDTAERKIAVSIDLWEDRIKVSDERGCSIELYYKCEIQQAKKEFDPKPIFQKTGGTVYKLIDFKSHLSKGCYIPPSVLTDLRRRALSALDESNKSTYHFGYRREENKNYSYLYDKLDYRENISNKLAEEFFHQHGVRKIERALECSNLKGKHNMTRIMTCRYCILKELGKCLKENGPKPNLPLSLRMGDGRKMPLKFDCNKCEMQVFFNK